MQKNAKPIYDSILRTTSKEITNTTLKENRIFTAVFYWYGRSRPTLCTAFTTHSEYKWPIVFALENDAKPLVYLSRNATYIT